VSAFSRTLIPYVVSAFSRTVIPYVVSAFRRTVIPYVVSGFSRTAWNYADAAPASRLNSGDARRTRCAVFVVGLP
jgi:hypothetical protein